MSQEQEYQETSPERMQIKQSSQKGEHRFNAGASVGKTALLYLHDVVYLLSIFLIILLIVFRVVVVSGPSMKDTLYDGDNLLVLSSTFYKNPQYADIVIVSKKSFENGDPIIKRVIATENQWVDIDFINGIVYVGEDPDHMVALDETAYTKQLTTMPEGMEFPQQVPKGHIFVMGDNRGNSKDSRSPQIGFVDKREVIGKAFFLVFPGTDYGNMKRDFGRIGVLH